MGIYEKKNKLISIFFVSLVPKVSLHKFEAEGDNYIFISWQDCVKKSI